MGKRTEETNTGEGVKGKKVRTTSDDAGGKSVSEMSKSTGRKCVSENSTFVGGKPGATRTSNNPFEASRSEKQQYFVDLVKDKRTKNNNLDHSPPEREPPSLGASPREFAILG